MLPLVCMGIYFSCFTNVSPKDSKPIIDDSDLKIYNLVLIYVVSEKYECNLTVATSEVCYQLLWHTFLVCCNIYI